jgi:hypothetical protein
MKQTEFYFDQELVWATASAAFRINGGYFKPGGTAKDQRANIEIINDLLINSDRLSDEDFVQGQQVRDYISKVATVAALKGTLDAWGHIMSRVGQLDTVADKQDLHVIASMPQTHYRYLQREQVHERLSATQDHRALNLGDKVEIIGEVVENKYSTKWSTHFITVIDTENRAWFFAYRTALPKSSVHTIRGTVKRLMDRMVQLNRVKLINGGNSD